MDGDEFAIAVGSAVVALFFLGPWYVRAHRVVAVVESRRRRVLLYLTQAGGFGLHLGILTLYSAREVRSDLQYIVLFMMVWAVALSAVTVWASALGVRAFEDWIQRNN